MAALSSSGFQSNTNAPTYYNPGFTSNGQSWSSPSVNAPTAASSGGPTWDDMLRAALSSTHSGGQSSGPMISVRPSVPSVSGTSDAHTQFSRFQPTVPPTSQINTMTGQPRTLSPQELYALQTMLHQASRGGYYGGPPHPSFFRSSTVQGNTVHPPPTQSNTAQSDTKLIGLDAFHVKYGMGQLGLFGPSTSNANSTAASKPAASTGWWRKKPTKPDTTVQTMSPLDEFNASCRMPLIDGGTGVSQVSQASRALQQSTGGTLNRTGVAQWIIDPYTGRPQLITHPHWQQPQLEEGNRRADDKSNVGSVISAASSLGKALWDCGWDITGSTVENTMSAASTLAPYASTMAHAATARGVWNHVYDHGLLSTAWTLLPLMGASAVGRAVYNRLNKS